MSQDKFNSLIDVPAINAEGLALAKILATVRAELTDTIAGAIKLNETLLNSTSSKTFAATSKAITDGLDKVNETQKKVVDTEAKQSAAREKQLNAYLVGLSKQQAQEDAAQAKRLAAIDKETAAVVAAQEKRKAVLAQTSSYQGSDPELSDADTNVLIAKNEALANERAALIAVAEAQQLNNDAKVQAATIGIEENEVLIASIENNILLKAQLAEVSAAIKETSVADSSLIAEQLRLTEAIKQNNTVISQQVKQDIAAEGSLVQKKAQLEELRLAYAQLNTAERENIEVGGIMLAEIKAQEAEYEKLVLEQGRARDAVGGYESAISKVIGRFDSLDKIGARVLQNVLRSVTRLAVEFTIFAAASAALEIVVTYIASLDLFKDKLDLAVETLKDFNEVVKNANVDIAKQSDTLGTLYRVATNVNNSMKDRLDASNELIKIFPKELDGLDALSIANGKQKGIIDDLTKSITENAKARAAKSKIDTLAASLLDIEFQKQKINNAEANELARSKRDEANGAFDGEGGGILAGNNEDKIKKRANDARTLADQQKAIVQGQIDFLTKFAGGDLAIAKAIEDSDKKKAKKPRATKVDNSDIDDLKAQADIFKKVADNDANSYEIRLANAKLYYDKLDQISKLEATKEIARGENRKNVDSLLNSNLTKNKLAYAAEVKKIEDDNIKQIYEANKANYKNLEDLAQQYSDKQLADLATNYSTISLALSDKYAKGLLTEKQYQEAKFALTKGYNKLVRDEEIRALQDRIDLAEAFGGDTTEFQKKIDALQIENNKEANSEKQKDNEDSGKKTSDQNQHGHDELKKLEKQAADEVINSIQSVGDARYEAAKAALETQKTAIDTQAQTEIDAENRSLDSTKAKQDKINIINAQANDRKAALDKQARKIDHDKAVFDREVAIAKIIEQTAIAVASAIGEFGVYGIAVGAVLAAIGAVEIATVLSTPLPAFAKGGKHKGGLMVAGELGTELMIDPSGKLGLTPSSATVMNAPAGTQIIDHMATMKILANPEKVQYIGGHAIDLSELVGVNRAMLAEMKTPAKGSTPNRNYREWNRVYNNYVN